MGEVIKFPTIEKQSPPVTPNETTNGSAELSVLSFKNISTLIQKKKR